MASPAIDVLMGVYRPDRPMLRRAIRSILDQTWKSLRLIICDDGSPDDTYSWLEHYAAASGRILLLRHEQNRGLAAALNTCLRYASADYVARQDADDYSLPDRLEKQVQFLQEHPAFSFAGSFLYLFDEQGVWGRKRYPLYPQKKDFLFSIPYMHGALIFRRAALLSCGGYQVSRITRRAEDYELLMRMYAQGHRGANLPLALYAFREDDSARLRRKYRYRIDEAQVRWEGFRRMGIGTEGLPYIVKPLIVGLIPSGLLKRLKERRYHLQFERR
ncbi:MAG: glycosyltransferase [Provencibacterium sp.]|jgi:glycosyltransferase EpsE|nr:glycosyltransferase [Provencibacterium sp.]